MKYLVVIAALLGLISGWWARGRFAPVIEEVRAADPMVSILRQALQRADARAVKITSEARQALDSFAVYQRRYQQLLRVEQRAETVLASLTKDPTVGRDSLVAACSVVVQTCRERADLADSVANVLRGQIANLLSLQPKRVSLGLFGGLGYDALKKRPVPVIGAGVLLRLR